VIGSGRTFCEDPVVRAMPQTPVGQGLVDSGSPHQGHSAIWFIQPWSTV